MLIREKKNMFSWPNIKLTLVRLLVFAGLKKELNAEASLNLVNLLFSGFLFRNGEYIKHTILCYKIILF